MTTATREQVVTALFNLLSGSSTFVTASRRFQLWNQVPDSQKPALFIREPSEQHAKNRNATPAVRTLDIEVYLYTAVGKDPNAVPASMLNKLIDAIDPTSGGVLAPDSHGRQTLGGLVADCFIDGEVLKEPGDLTGQGAAMIPLKIVFM